MKIIEIEEAVLMLNNSLVSICQQFAFERKFLNSKQHEIRTLGGLNLNMK